jgi:NCS1 family nucleobase:cation symporter-1
METRTPWTWLENHTIRPIPADERHGTAADQFTVWCGSSFTLLTIATGGLAVTVFALPFAWAVLGLALGNFVGAFFMALHAAQGPTLGVPQMIQTRGQFGSLGSVLVIGIVLIMTVGFLASGLVLGGEALASSLPNVAENRGIIAIGLLSLVTAVFGYNLIHGFARVMTYVSGATLVITFA